jgi:ATP-dependent DNA helicase RecG
MMKAPNYPIKSPIENETVNSKNETVKSKICETVNINGGSSEGVDNQQELTINETKSQDNAVGENSENETVKSKIRETVKIKNETVNETVKVSSKVVKRLVKRYPGVNSRRLAEIIGKSRATIMRFISELKNKGEIVFKGSAKSGGHFIA